MTKWLRLTPYDLEAESSNPSPAIVAKNHSLCDKHFKTFASIPVANLIKHFMIVIYDSRVILTTNLPTLQL